MNTSLHYYGERSIEFWCSMYRFCLAWNKTTMLTFSYIKANIKNILKFTSYSVSFISGLHFVCEKVQLSECLNINVNINYFLHTKYKGFTVRIFKYVDLHSWTLWRLCLEVLGLLKPLVFESLCNWPVLCTDFMLEVKSI